MLKTYFLSFLLLIPLITFAAPMPDIPYDSQGVAVLCPEPYQVPTFVGKYEAPTFTAYKLHNKTVIYINLEPFTVFISYDGENIKETYTSMEDVANIYPNPCDALEHIWENKKFD